MTRWLIVALIASAWTSDPFSRAEACPGCPQGGNTFGQEFATMDVVIIARLVKAPAEAERGGDEIQKATFQIASIIKGEKAVKIGQRFETLYFGNGQPGQSFLVTGIGPHKVMWSTPLPVSERAIKYFGEIVKLPLESDKRLVYFQQYLEDDDANLARDAYDEFARAPYTQIKALKPHLDHEQIVRWIKDPEVSATRRRLYLVMLGVCGDQADVPMLEGFLRSTDRKDKAGLDMIVSSYLLLRGAAGLPLVEELFLANPKAAYVDTYAAIMAIRLHGNDFDTVDKQALIKSLRVMLDRPELADLVIPDLARWEDWEVMEKLVDIYKNVDPKNSWVRVPVVIYLRQCPLPKAKELLRECERIDATSVKRSLTFFPAAPGDDESAD